MARISWTRVVLSMFVAAIIGSTLTILGQYAFNRFYWGSQFPFSSTNEIIFIFLICFIIWLLGLLSLGTVMVMVLRFFNKNTLLHWTSAGAFTPGGFWFLPGLPPLLGFTDPTYCMQTSPSILVCWAALLKQSALIATTGMFIGIVMWLIVFGRGDRRQLAPTS